jgi:hypothetical protein
MANTSKSSIILTAFFIVFFFVFRQYRAWVQETCTQPDKFSLLHVAE